MRIIYLANSRIPTEKAHGLEIFKLCEALHKCDDVTMILPRRFNKIKDNPFQYYGIKNNFRIVSLPVVDTIVFSTLGRLGFWIEAITFFVSVFWYILFKTKYDDIFISHDNAPLLAASFIRKNIFYDVHDFPVRGLFFYRILMNRSCGIIATNKWKKDKLVEKFGLNQNKILVYPNGVEITDFDIALSRSEARKKLNISKNKKVVVYTGSFIYWKGVETLIHSAELIKDTMFYFVGGNKDDLLRLGISYNNKDHIVIIENRPHKEVPLWLRSADVLVLPNTAKEDISKFYTSPMKLFEYMASGTPIVASDLPSIRNIVDERFVSFFTPDNPNSMAQVINSVFKDYKSVLIKSKAASQEVKKYTWDKRAEHIKDFYENKSRK